MRFSGAETAILLRLRGDRAGSGSGVPITQDGLSIGGLFARQIVIDPVYMSRKIRKFRTDKFDT